MIVAKLCGALRLQEAAERWGRQDLQKQELDVKFKDPPHLFLRWAFGNGRNVVFGFQVENSG